MKSSRARATGLLLAIVTVLGGCQSAGLAFINAAAPATSRVEDIAFGDGPRRGMDIYAPRQRAAGPAGPLVVFWYGGAWMEGSKHDYRFVGAALASRGLVTAIPDYRLYPEVRFPEFLRDAAAAVARAQREAPRHGADAARTVLGGHSAGAYIAAMLALQPEYLREAGVDPASVVGFFGLSGPYAIVPDTQALKEIFNSRAQPAQFQAIAQVSAKAPRALLIHGSADTVVYVSHSEKLAQALRAQGVSVELRIIPGRRHVDTVLALSRPGAFRIPGLADRISEFAHTAR
ncbi:MAG: alpha/beta hydrolase [Steroidobacteraceae bacterium]